MLEPFALYVVNLCIHLCLNGGPWSVFVLVLTRVIWSKFLLARCLSFNRYQRYRVSPILLWGSVSSGDYLRFLAANGHTLAEVEEVVTGTRTADDAYDSYLRVKEGQQPDDE